MTGTGPDRAGSPGAGAWSRLLPSPDAGRRLLAAVERHPVGVFRGFALAQLLVWTLLPALLFANLPLDVIESLAWGHEWQLGYYKHPPAPAWILEALTWPFGRMAWPAYFASAAALLVTEWAVFRLSREIVGATGAVLSVLLTSLVYYYTLPLIEFNHNVLQMPLWALLGLFGWLALSRNRQSDWLWLGLVVGLSVYVKYSLALMVATLLAFALLTGEFRARLLSRGFAAALGVAVVVAAPHLYWMYASDFVSLAYAGERTRPIEGGFARLYVPLLFPLGQLLNHVALGAVLWLGGAGLRAATATLPDEVAFAAGSAAGRRYVLWIAVVPLLFLTLVSFATGKELRAMWGAPMFSFSALALLLVLRPALRRDRFHAMALGWGALQAAVIAALLAMALVGSHATRKPLRTDFPGAAIAAAFDRLWRERTGAPLAFVDGDAWIGGNIAWYAPDRPTLVSTAQPTTTPWLVPRELRCRGRLLVWDAGDDQRLPTADRGVLEFPARGRSRPWRIAWETVPPDAAACRDSRR